MVQSCAAALQQSSGCYHWKNTCDSRGNSAALPFRKALNFHCSNWNLLVFLSLQAIAIIPLLSYHLRRAGMSWDLKSRPQTCPGVCCYGHYAKTPDGCLLKQRGDISWSLPAKMHRLFRQTTGMTPRYACAVWFAVNDTPVRTSVPVPMFW